MIIRVENLSYVYMEGSPFEKKALEDISMGIEKGEFIGIIGHTGSGKSTLIQHFNGLLKPTKGKVIIEGLDTSGKNLRELRKKVGIVFQYPEHQLFEESVYEDVAFGLKKMDKNKDEISHIVDKVMGIVGLEKKLLGKSPFELSGGEKRRVAIAGVLAMEPEIIILDEPAAGLDPRGRNEIFAFVDKLYRDYGKTIILVSHNMEEITRLVKRVVVMEEGKIVMDGATKLIFKDTEKLEKLGLSAPQITYFMKKMKAIFPDIDDNLYTVKDAKNELLKHFKKVKGDRDD